MPSPWGYKSCVMARLLLHTVCVYMLFRRVNIAIEAYQEIVQKCSNDLKFFSEYLIDAIILLIGQDSGPHIILGTQLVTNMDTGPSKMRPLFVLKPKRKFFS